MACKRGHRRDAPFVLPNKKHRILQYHPADASHHGGAYFKISFGETGTIRIDLDGNIIE